MIFRGPFFRKNCPTLRRNLPNMEEKFSLELSGRIFLIFWTLLIFLISLIFWMIFAAYDRWTQVQVGSSSPLRTSVSIQASFCYFLLLTYLLTDWTLFEMFRLSQSLVFFPPQTSGFVFLFSSICHKLHQNSKYWSSHSCYLLTLAI